MDIEDTPAILDTRNAGRPEAPNTAVPLRRRQRAVAGSAPMAAAADDDDADGPPQAPSSNVYMYTFGCGHNVSDGEYMAGQLASDGHTVTDEFAGADCYVINSCTVKNPSEDHFVTLLKKARNTGKPVVVAGCVPQGDPKNKQWSDVSVVGVRQIDRIGYVVNEAMQGNTVRLFEDADVTTATERTAANGEGATKKGRGSARASAAIPNASGANSMPTLALPKVRRNKLIEIVPINAGCLNFCTYCKTKHARGDLQSWPVEDIVRRVRAVVAEGIVEIRMTSEDTGAYGIDIGTDIVTLMKAVVRELEGTRVMLRLGMSNPPYLLRHLDGMCDVLRHPNVFEFLHLPVQSGSDAILDVMKREYTVGEFERCVDTFQAKVPRIGLSTDIICAFPGEGEREWQETVALCRKYEFPFLNISRFYARRDTPAAAMKQVPTTLSKQRSVALTALYNSYTGFNDFLVGTEQDMWVTEVAHDKHHLVGHTKQGFVQVLVDPTQASLGDHVTVRVTEAAKYSAKGTVIKINETARILSAHSAAETSAAMAAASPAVEDDCPEEADEAAGEACGKQAAPWATAGLIAVSLISGYLLARRHGRGASS